MKLRVFLVLATALAILAYFVSTEERRATIPIQHAEEPAESGVTEPDAGVRQHEPASSSHSTSAATDSSTTNTHVHDNSGDATETASVRTTVGVIETKKSINLPIVDVASRDAEEDKRALPGTVGNDERLANLEPGSQTLIHDGGPLDGRGQDPHSSGAGPDGTVAGHTSSVDIASQMPGPGDGVSDDALPSMPNFELPGDDVDDPDGNAPE